MDEIGYVHDLPAESLDFLKKMELLWCKTIGIWPNFYGDVLTGALTRLLQDTVEIQRLHFYKFYQISPEFFASETVSRLTAITQFVLYRRTVMLPIADWHLAVLKMTELDTGRLSLSLEGLKMVFEEFKLGRREIVRWRFIMDVPETTLEVVWSFVCPELTNTKTRRNTNVISSLDNERHLRVHFILSKSWVAGFQFLLVDLEPEYFR